MTEFPEMTPEQKAIGEIATRLKTEADRQAMMLMQNIAINTLADAIREGYALAMSMHGLAPRPDGITQTEEVVIEEEEQRWTFVSDNDGHDYMIPADKLEDWTMWRNIPEDNEASWDVPDYALCVDGGRVTFTNPLVA